VKIYSTTEIVEEVNRYVLQHPHLKNRAAKLIQYIQNVDKEFLLEGKTSRTAVYGSKEAVESAVKVARFGRGISVVGVAFTAYDLSVATKESIQLKSVKPLAAEGIRQVGGWGSAIGGFKLGFGTGALMGVETGPGLFVTGLVGGLVVGTMGYFGADWVADKIHEN